MANHDLSSDFTDATVKAVAQSLIDDPFYRSITVDADSASARLATLERYFAYSLDEARRLGRSTVASDPSHGAAAWILPRSEEVRAREGQLKQRSLGKILGPRGYENYRRIVDFMHPLAEAAVPDGAWYLSIIGVSPQAQGRGVGAKLLAPTLAEATAAGRSCFLETFSARNLSFYERLGFVIVARHFEPTSKADYRILLRGA